jgi:DNA-binding NtrC family response regulator
VLDSYAYRLRAIELATPAERPDDIPRLLDALIIEEHARAGGGELLPVAALGAANLDALKAHPWPDHFVELRAQAKRLHAVLTNDLRLRASARALGLKSPPRWCRPSIASACAWPPPTATTSPPTTTAATCRRPPAPHATVSA